MPFTVPACVVTVSDRCSRGAAEDRSGPLAAELVAAALPGATVARALVPDGADSVRAAIVGALRDGARLVVTTGGTGVGPRDRTPEGTAGLLDREIPGIAEQIRSGGPVTITHPDVTRYFMTIPEACQLIVQAAAAGSHAAIYTLDMGEPVPIRLLAEQMIRLAGKQPGRDIAVVYTGLRPGEKLHETLFYADEHYRPTSHSKILEAGAREVWLATDDERVAAAVAGTTGLKGTASELGQALTGLRI